MLGFLRLGASGGLGLGDFDVTGFRARVLRLRSRVPGLRLASWIGSTSCAHSAEPAFCRRNRSVTAAKTSAPDPKTS